MRTNAERRPSRTDGKLASAAFALGAQAVAANPAAKGSRRGLTLERLWYQLLGGVPLGQMQTELAPRDSEPLSLDCSEIRNA
jgi:hypothetical protein